MPPINLKQEKMEEVRPNGKRAKYAVLLIWIVLALEVVSLTSGYLQYNLLQAFALGENVAEDVIAANDTREQLVGLLYLVAFVTSMVTFILWFRRAYYNLHLKTDNLRHSEGWAAGSWFVPIICLFKPYHIMKELYTETKALLLRNGFDVSYQFHSRSLGWWWALWIISNFLGQIVFRNSMGADSIEELTNSTTAAIVLNLLGIPLALLTVKVIKDYAKVEHLLSEIPVIETTEETGYNG